MKKIILCLISLTFILFIILEVQKKKLLIIDTVQKEPYFYDISSKIAKLAGFKIFYKPISDIFDTNIEDLGLEKYDSLIFLISNEFFNSLNNLNPVNQKVLKLIKFCLSLKNKKIGFILPDSFFVNSEEMDFLEKLINKLGIDLSTMLEKSLTDLLKLFVATYNPQYSKVFYDTTLLKKQTDIPIVTPTLSYILQNKIPFFDPKITDINFNLKYATVAAFPARNLACDKIFSSFEPFGIYWFNAVAKNHFFIMRQSTFNVASLNEDVRISPLSQDLLLDQLKICQEAFFELANCTDNGFGLDLEKLNFNLNLPDITNLISKNNELDEKKIKCAWSDFYIFENINSYDQNKLLISSVVDAGIDYLWLSVKPNIAYSPIGDMKNRDKIVSCIKNFKQICHEVISENEKPFPKILIGYELNWNLYGNNLPKNPALDIYGKTYFDMPNPLDQKFWNDEIILSLEGFLSDWSEVDESMIEVSGIVIDLEFYTRRSCDGMFNSVMGFDDLTLSWLYSRRISAKSIFDEFYKRAESIGRNIRDKVTMLLPNSKIGVYMPVMDLNWFYKGLLSGLSEEDKPIIFMTFNTESKKHKSWLLKNQIFAKHLGVLMLSKLQDTKSFNLIDEMNSKNDGIWFNKWSRLFEDYSKSDLLERIPINAFEKNDPNGMKFKESFINYLGR